MIIPSVHYRTVCTSIVTGLLVASLTACGDDSSSTDVGFGEDVDMSADAGVLDDAGSSDSGSVDAGSGDVSGPTDSGPTARPCPRDPNGVCGAVTWTSTSARYPVPVDHHTTLITESALGPQLVVIGGVRSNSQGGADEVYSAVRRAPIGADGAVGTFVDAPALPIPLGFHAQVVSNGFVYLFAGVTQDAQGPSAQAGIVFGELSAGGVVESWRRSDLAQEVRVHPTAEKIGDTVYVIGGTGPNGVVRNTVLAGSIKPDGSPGDFKETVPLPEPRSHHTSVQHNGRIYIIGGFGDGQTPRGDVLRSTHDASGMLTGWETLFTINDPQWTASGVVYEDTIILFGGGRDSSFIDSVMVGPMDVNGDMSSLEEANDPLPVARSHVHQTPVYDGRVYSVGGRIFAGFGMAPTDQVFVGELW